MCHAAATSLGLHVNLTDVNAGYGAGMLHHAVLHDAVLHHAVLHHAVLHHAVLCYILLCCAIPMLCYTSCRVPSSSQTGLFMYWP